MKVLKTMVKKHLKKDIKGEEREISDDKKLLMKLKMHKPVKKGKSCK